MTPALQDEGRVPQVAQADAFLSRQRMGGGEGDQQLLAYDGDVGDKLGIRTRAECQIDLTAANGMGLLSGIAAVMVWINRQRIVAEEKASKE